MKKMYAKIYGLGLFMLVLFLAFSCQKSDAIDTEKPSISTDFTDAFPQNCDTLYFGETFNFVSLFEDNAELGSFSLDIHHNFDHHSHTTEVSACSLEEKKDAVNSLTFINDYDIPEGQSVYESDLYITLPASSDSLYQEGDYHFFISLVDKQGWSSQQGLSIKILHRR